MPAGNYTALSGNISSGVDFFVWLNSNINDMFFVGIIGAIWFIMLIKLLFSDNSFARSFTAASFICFILTTLLRVIDLVATPFMITFLIFTVVGVVWTHAENSGRFA